MAQQDIDDLTAEVEADVTVMASATTLINGFAARLGTLLQASQDLGALQTALRAEIAVLKSSAGDLSAAVVANTPAKP